MSTIRTHDITQPKVELGKPTKPKLARQTRIERNGIVYNSYAEMAAAEQKETEERTRAANAKAAEERVERIEREREERQPAAHDGLTREFDDTTMVLGDAAPFAVDLSGPKRKALSPDVANDGKVTEVDGEAPGIVLLPQGDCD